VTGFKFSLSGGGVRRWAAVGFGGSEEAARTDSETEGNETSDADAGSSEGLDTASAAAAETAAHHCPW